MTTVFDAAAYVLEKTGPIPAMKLQKLVYYAQAWSLVWDDAQLFDEPIQAWANGPVCPSLYVKHRQKYMVASMPGGQMSHLAASQKETIDAVLRFYGDKSSQWLSDLTHAEPPWRDARAGLAPGEPGYTEISWAAMAEYYGSL